MIRNIPNWQKPDYSLGESLEFYKMNDSDYQNKPGTSLKKDKLHAVGFPRFPRSHLLETFHLHVPQFQHDVSTGERDRW